ncbi:glycosyltransferase family 29 protein [Methylobrevis albus]|uniref:Glycosyltransferase family 29 protein n=1 Tax=Methylobrevis albus TaxID=2793297 RepID=A0A931I578_9HYPH|nr:glycosyltransferase family 29 protein [Methylobrevis albus]MBH0239506.1 glycosyltransferase family 29 protein [Methylobrevis albus]
MTSTDDNPPATPGDDAVTRRIAARAKAAARAGDFEGAARLWRKCHLLGMPRARMRQASCLARAGQPVEAARIAAGRLGSVPAGEVYDFVEDIGLALVKRGDLDLAERVWAEVARIDGHAPYAASKIMTLRSKAGGLDEPALGEAAAFLAGADDPLQTSARSALVMLWTREGASQRLLDLCRAVMARAPAVAAAMAADEFALLAALGRDAEIIDRLKAEPALTRLAATSPPIAALVAGGAVAAADPAHHAAAAAVIAAAAHLRAERDRLWSDLADPALRIAVVGNSGIEIGRGNGAAIDAHDVVVRFNDFSVAPAFAPDYGTRTDVLVRAATDRQKLIRNVGPDTRLVLAGVRFMQLCRNWSLPIDLIAAGYRVACFPDDAADPLMARLDARPSAGLTVLGLLARLRGGLANVGTYGFSMIDQIGPDAASAHYFEKARPSSRHDWAAERAIYDELLVGRLG